MEFVRNNQVPAFGLTGQQFFRIGLLLLLGVYYGWKRRGAQLASAA